MYLYVYIDIDIRVYTYICIYIQCAAEVPGMLPAPRRSLGPEGGALDPARSRARRPQNGDGFIRTLAGAILYSLYEIPCPS